MKKHITPPVLLLATFLNKVLHSFGYMRMSGPKIAKNKHLFPFTQWLLNMFVSYQANMASMTFGFLCAAVVVVSGKWNEDGSRSVERLWII